MRRFVVEQKKDISSLANEKRGRGVVGGTVPLLCFRGLNENSSITYNNVKNITYKGTQAKDTKFIYNSVENINKEAVELHNTYRTNSKSSGVNTGVTVGYGQKVQTKGNGVNFSTNRSHLNTDETIYYNGNFNNVDKVLVLHIKICKKKS